MVYLKIFSLLSFIDLSNLNTSNIEYKENIFKGISDQGIFIFNSTIFDEKLLNSLPDKWSKIDIK